MTDRTAADWDQVLTDLGRDLDKATGALGALDVERQPLPLLAATGDSDAGKALASIDRRRQDLRARIDLLRDGLEDARARHRAAVAAEAEAQAAARLAAARLIALEIKALDHDEIDPAMARLEQAMTRRRELVMSLSQHGALTTTHANKLRNQTMMSASLHYAGLHHHLPLARVPSHFWTSLEEWDVRWLAPLLPAGSVPSAPVPQPSLPPLPPAPEGGGMTEEQWEAAEEREAARSFGRRAA